MVEPDRVSPLGGGGGIHPRRNRNAGRLEAHADAYRLAEAAFLAGSQQHRAVVADEHRVVHVDGIGIAGIVLGDDHLGPCRNKDPAKPLVLGGGRRRVGHAVPAVALDVTRVRGQGRAHEHPLEVTPHRLRAVAGHDREG